MNIFAILILFTLTAGYILGLISERLNLRNLSPDLPSEFSGIYDEETYAKSQNYTRTKTQFGFITSTFDLIVLLVFWFAGGFNWLDVILRGSIENDIIRGLIFIGSLSLTGSLISLPFSIYATFVIEEKFGFNNTTVKTFILDMFKGLGLTLVIGAPVLTLILYIIGSLGSIAFLVAWAAVALISLIMTYIAPSVIMPLFNKFTPLEEGELRLAIFGFAQKVNFPLTNIFVMDGSKRSSKSNAFFTGFGKNKRIALFDTLIEKHTVPELVAILAHEIGHYKKKHILQGTLIGYIHMGIIFYLLSIFINQQGLFDAFYMNNISVYAGLMFFGMLYTPLEMLISIFMNILSRKNEFEAYIYEKVNTHDSDSMISALKKLSKDNLSNLTPHRFYVFLNYSHPPVLERINHLRNQQS
jgi:STE24 endopeptidase